MASRMPNSRVRALTEKASTPPTPTTAIARATTANPPKTRAFNRSGVSTSARTSSRVAARSTGWSTDRLRIVRVIGVISAYGSLRTWTKSRPPNSGPCPNGV